MTKPTAPPYLLRHDAHVALVDGIFVFLDVAADLADVVDLSAGFDAAIWSLEWAEWICDWRAVARLDRKIPASWLLGDAAIRDGCRGLLFPSLRHAGGTNLVVFSANLTADDRLEVHDPDGRLPRDQRSWSET